MPVVSVIIPTYNRRDMIMGAVDSVLQQDFSDVEVLVGDDASTDNTEELFQDVDPRVRFFRYETNRGQCVTRNRLIAEARGEYVIFLDSDDRLLPGRISKGLKEFERDPELAFTYCAMKFIFLDGREDLGERARFPVPRPEHWLEDVLMGAYLPTSSYMLRRDILGMKPFDETMITSVDQDCWLRVCTGRKGSLVDEPLVEYSVHNRGRTTDVRGNREAALRRIESLSRLYHRAIAKGREAGLSPSFLRKSRVYHTCLIADHCLFNGLRRQALRWWLAGVAHSPLSLKPYRGLVHGIVPEPVKKVYRALFRKGAGS